MRITAAAVSVSISSESNGSSRPPTICTVDQPSCGSNRLMAAIRPAAHELGCLGTPAVGAEGLADPGHTPR